MRKSILVFCVLVNFGFALEENKIEDKSIEEDKEIVINVTTQNDNIGENTVRSHESMHSE
ncbi:hypothetical protein [Sebaldella sp. S0638]|uniref:hypothetical protein n=1 Tax=Sebaldella sp. S0638 TaxID=2957809 RepID=UPI0020A0821F|nr:hypothetical protein [Sebaldella sp. S0638]